jgi:4-hydroxybenzoyl-CoA thioesterase
MTKGPETSRVASFISRRQFTVEWGQCDPAGIVFNSRFFEFFDTSTWMLFGAFGIIGIPLVDARANFTRPVKFGEAVEIASHVSEFLRSSFYVEHRMTINGELAVEGVETRVWAARDKTNPEKIGGVKIPAEVIARFG